MTSVGADRTHDLVIFDLDGTLVDSMGAQATAFSMAVEQVDSSSVSFEEARHIYNTTAGAPLRDQFSEAIGTDDADDLARLEAAFWTHLDGMTFTPFDDAIHCVDHLVATGVALGISSGSSCASVQKKVADSGLTTRIPIALGSDDPDIGPKGAAHVERIVQHHFADRASAELRIAFVGDTTHDVTLALELGLEAFGIQRDAYLLPKPVPGAHILTNLRDLPNLLQLRRATS